MLFLLRFQRQKTELLLTFLIGLILGVALSKFLRYTCTAMDEVANNVSQALNAYMISENSTHELTLPELLVNNQILLATKISKQTRILCMIMTAPKYHKQRAMHVKRTWGKRCNILLFMSTNTDAELGTIKLAVREGYSNMWNKTREALRYVYEHHLNDADWFLKAHDDTYVIMENLQTFLYSYSAEAPVYFGNQLKAQQNNENTSGGSAHVLSKAALRRFVEQAYQYKRICRSAPFGFEPKELERCLRNVGVVAGDSFDEQKLQHFHSLSPFRSFKWNKQGRFIGARYIANKTELSNYECYSSLTIAFHHTFNAEFYIFEFFIYKLRPFGIAWLPEILPQKQNMKTIIDK